MSKPSPDKIHGKILAEVFLTLCREISKETGAKDIRVCAELLYRDAKGDLKMNVFITPAGSKERLLEGDACMAHKSHASLLTERLKRFCAEIFKESQASGIRATCEFVFHNGKGDLKMKSFITPDGTTERMLDSEVLMPRGSKLQREAQTAMRRVMIAAGRRS